MVEVFTTNIPSVSKAVDIITSLKDSFSDLKISFDKDREIIHYPCDHSILRVEGESIAVEVFKSVVHKLGYKCDILEDKLCSK